jgi:hypothetical protein
VPAPCQTLGSGYTSYKPTDNHQQGLQRLHKNKPNWSPTSSVYKGCTRTNRTGLSPAGSTRAAKEQTELVSHQQGLQGLLKPSQLVTHQQGLQGLHKNKPNWSPTSRACKGLHKPRQLWPHTRVDTVRATQAATVLATRQTLGTRPHKPSQLVTHQQDLQGLHKPRQL